MFLRVCPFSCWTDAPASLLGPEPWRDREHRKPPGDPAGSAQRDLVPSFPPLGPLRLRLCAMEGAQLVALLEVWPWQGRGAQLRGGHSWLESASHRGRA